MRSLALLLVLATILAGCSNAAPPAEDPDDVFDDKKLEADEKTGVIRGVVVDDSFTPVAGATIATTIDGKAQSATSDEQGRFGFSKVPPGTYFLKVSAPLHTEVQSTATVVAGVDQPDILSIQIARVYPGDPFVTPIKQEGFFTCSQAGMLPYVYVSSPCHAIAGGVDLCDLAGACLDQNRDFHADVEGGWQTQVFEMTWEATAQGTSDRMGVTFSTYKPERNGDHWFASYGSKAPLRMQFDVGVAHETAQEGSGPAGPVPAEGMKDMSYFISVREPEGSVCVRWCAPPGLALDQSFVTYLHQFYYLPAPEGWSAVAGDEIPY